MPCTTVADYLIERLKQIGLKHLFAVPGDYASSFLLALDATPGIERIPTINELGSGYAADGYARFQGIGAACVQYGVGTLSMINCTAGSFVERLPIVVISASPSANDRRLEHTEDILFHHSTGNLRADQIMMRQVTVASEIIRDPATAHIQIDRALTALLTHHKPVYIEVIQNVWNLECAPPVGTLAPHIPSSNAAALLAAVDSAFARIQSATLPVLWLGVQIQRYGLQDLMQQIVDASGLFFTTTSLGKTVLDESQPLFAGTYAGPASPAATNQLMLQSDCPVALGTIITDDYLDIMAQSFSLMIEVTDQETRIGQSYYHQVTLKDFLAALLAKFQGDPSYPRTYSLPVVPPQPPVTIQPSDPVTYNIFYEGLTSFLKNEALLDQTVLVLGESTSLYVFGNVFGMPRNSFVAQAAWGSLGHETGSALGVALGSGKRPFVVAGDGGFMMICQELSSLARQKSNAAVFVMSNQAYAIEQAFVDIKAFTPTGQFAAFDLLPTWDYAALAKAFGVIHYEVRTAGDLETVLQQIKALQGVPSLIQVVIPQKDLAPQLERLATTP